MAFNLGKAEKIAPNFRGIFFNKNSKDCISLLKSRGRLSRNLFTLLEEFGTFIIQKVPFVST